MNNIIIKVPDDHVEYIGYSELTFCISFKFDVCENDIDWEVYNIHFKETGGDIAIKINKLVMDFSREIEEDGGGPIEELVFRLLINHVSSWAEEQEKKDFFEEISD